MVANLVSKTSKNLIFEEPFYGLFLVGLNKSFTDKIPTAGVSKNGIGVQLTVNPDFFNSLSERHRIGLLKHELLHISFGHLIMRDMYNNHKLFNIAADLEINQYIDHLDLPEGGLSFDSFPELQFPNKAGTKVYYNILEEAHQDGSSPSLDSLMDQMDGNSSYCHSTWDDFEDIPEAEKKLIQKQIDHQVKENADVTEKRCGSIPGELADLIQRLRHVEPAKFDWKGYLRRFVGNSSIVFTKKIRRKYNDL